MINKIEPIPQIPEALRTAALSRKLVPFIGAGVSQLVGCCGWNDLANAALKVFIDKNVINHAHLQQFSSLSPRTRLSLALELEKRHKIKIDFKRLLSPHKKKIDDNIYENISKLATTFVTTNYDHLLDRSSPTTLRTTLPNGPPSSTPSTMPLQHFYRREDLCVDKMDTPNAVFHIHGSVKDRDSMVITTVHYLQRYASHRMDGREDSENPFLSFLEHLFRTRNVLFMGYGLEELEVLEFVVQKGTQKRLDRTFEYKHYVLQGFFSHELELSRHMEVYFGQFGIGLLPFLRDDQDWHQLSHVIADFAAGLPPGADLPLTIRQEMEALLS